MHDAHRAVQRKLAKVHAEAHELRMREIARVEDFCRQQTRRIAVDLAKHTVTRLDPGGTYSLTTKGGTHPGTVTLDHTPDQLLRREGEAGYRRYGSLSLVPGN